MVQITVTTSTAAELEQMARILRHEGIARVGNTQERTFYFRQKFSGELTTTTTDTTEKD